MRVRDLYRAQCDRDERFIRIDCSDADGQMLPAADIFQAIRSQIDALL